MTGASAVIGLRRFWAGEGAGALPYSSPLLEGKRTKNKGQREQEASRTAALVSRCRGRLVYSQGLCSRSGPGPATALFCSVLCSPQSGHAPTLPHTSLIFLAGNCDMWSPALPSLRGHRNRNSCQYLLDQAMALLISIRYYMWLLMPSNSCDHATILDILEIIYWAVMAAAQQSCRIQTPSCLGHFETLQSLYPVSVARGWGIRRNCQVLP